MNKPKYTLLNIRGTFYKTTLTKKFTNRIVWKKPNSKEVVSVLPGTIVKIYVNTGSQVQKGDYLYTFEAMKMENKVLAPISGIIKKINFYEGERFPKGVVIIEFE